MPQAETSLPPTPEGARSLEQLLEHVTKSSLIITQLGLEVHSKVISWAPNLMLIPNSHEPRHFRCHYINELVPARSE